MELNYYYSKAHRRRIGVELFNRFSMLFDGVDEHLNIDNTLTNVLATTTKGTWSLWVKPVDATPTGTEVFISFGDVNANELFYVHIVVGGECRFTVNIAGVSQWQVQTDAAVFSDNTWTYVAVVQDGTEPIIYIDGIKPAQTFDVTTNKTKWFNDAAGLDNGRIGDYNFLNLGESAYFNGNIDEVSFWDIDLTLTEIQEIYNNGRPTNLLKHSLNSNLVSWFRMGDKSTFDGSNFTFPDQKGSNDAQSVNMEFADKILDVI